MATQPTANSINFLAEVPAHIAIPIFELLLLFFDKMNEGCTHV